MLVGTVMVDIHIPIELKFEKLKRHIRSTKHPKIN